MPCKQSTEWGTLIVLFVFLMVSVSSLSQITTGRPWERNTHTHTINQSTVSKGRAVARERANSAPYIYMWPHRLRILRGNSDLTCSQGNRNLVGFRNLFKLTQLRNTKLSYQTVINIFGALLYKSQMI